MIDHRDLLILLGAARPDTHPHEIRNPPGEGRTGRAAQLRPIAWAAQQSRASAAEFFRKALGVP